MSLRLILISEACAIRPYKQVSVIKSEWTDSNTPNTICFKIMMRQKWHLNCIFPLLFPSHKVIKHKERIIHMIKVRDWRRPWGGWCSGWASLLSLLSHGQELSSLLEQCRHWDEQGGITKDAQCQYLSGNLSNHKEADKGGGNDTCNFQVLTSLQFNSITLYSTAFNRQLYLFNYFVDKDFI